MAFHQNYSCGACFKGAILGETQGNSVLCLNDNKNCIGFCSCGQNDPKDFLKTEESMREACSGKENAEYLQGWWEWVLLPDRRRALRFQPSLQGWRGAPGALGCALGTGTAGKDICAPPDLITPSTARPPQQEMGGWEVPAVSESWIVDFAPGCQGRTLPQDCSALLGSFLCQFLFKGKKNTSSHTLRNQAGPWGHWKHNEASALCWGCSGLWKKHKNPTKTTKNPTRNTKNPTRMCCAPAQAQTCGWTQEPAGGCL